MPSFVEVGAPTGDELHALLQTIITRLMKMLTCRGLLVEEMGETYLTEPHAEGDEARTLRPLQVTARSGAIFPGWWRRDGAFLLTIAGTQRAEPPAPLDGGGDLAAAVPTHSWIERPLLWRYCWLKRSEPCRARARRRRTAAVRARR